jgi:hypothetical protein
MLRRHGLITEWFDYDIEAGTGWRSEIDRELGEADVILLLVSADFLASDFCYEDEMLRAVGRAERNEVTLIPVMLRPVDGWQSTPFAKFQAVPREARPVSTFADADEAYAEVAASLRSALEAKARASGPLPGETGAATGRSRDLSRDSEAISRVDQVAGALSDLMTRTSGAWIIVHGDRDANIYVQCYSEPDAFWCEAVGNDYLDAAHALTSRQTSELAALGWSPPGSDLGNWWCVKHDADEVTELFVRTLRVVYGIELNVPFEIDYSWEL